MADNRPIHRRKDKIYSLVKYSVTEARVCCPMCIEGNTTAVVFAKRKALYCEIDWQVGQEQSSNLPPVGPIVREFLGREKGEGAC